MIEPRSPTPGAFSPSADDSYGPLEDLRSALWRDAALGSAIDALAKRAGLEPRIASVPATVPEAVLEDASLTDRWVEALAEYLHIEADGVHCNYPDLEPTIASLAPAIVRVPTLRGDRYLAVLRSNARRVTLLCVGGTTLTIPCARLRDVLAHEAEESVRPDLERMLDLARVEPSRRPRSLKLLFAQRLTAQQIGGLWILRPSPGASLWLQAKTTGVLYRLAGFFGLMVLQSFFGLLAWFLMGKGSVEGRIGLSTLQSWALLSLTTVPLGAFQGWLAGRIGVDIAGIVKRRLLLGAFKLSPTFIREKGSGQLLAMIGESQVLESAGFSSALSAVSAVLSLVTAMGILAQGIGGALHVGLLALWSVIVGIATFVLARRTAGWTAMRMQMTNRLVERMVGHRTRAVQEQSKYRHVVEDDELERYLATSRQMDLLNVIVDAIPSRGWLAVGFLGMLPALIAGHASVGELLITIGGLFAAQGAFGGLVSSIDNFVALTVAWRSIRPLFVAATARESSGLPNVIVAKSSVESSGQEEQLEELDPELVAKNKDAVLEVRNVSFRYRSGGDPVLRNVSMILRDGDRVLLEGQSGGGKSTFAGVLAGLQSPEAGLVLLRGLDRGSIGASAWRKRIASAPQFHENHIVTGTLGFNLLLGRRWPPEPQDLEDARSVCEALDLGPLLEKMPSGLEQMLGETGWQLSHGEKSRIFLARALLQEAEVVMLDESFGALDPLTLKTCMDATLERAPTLVVIAHP